MLNSKMFTAIKKSNKSRSEYNEVSFYAFLLYLVTSDSYASHLFKIVFSTQCSVGLAGKKKAVSNYCRLFVPVSISVSVILLS